LDRLALSHFTRWLAMVRSLVPVKFGRRRATDGIDRKEYNMGMSGFGFAVRNRIAFALLLSVGIASALNAQDSAKRGRKYKAPPETSHVEITVLRASTGKPVENASVIFHPLVDGKNSGNMELKTNDEGKATIDLLEIGSNVRLQIIKPGFQTYGEDYKIDKDTMTIEVKLNRPAEQYSTYKHAADAAKAEKAGPKPDATPAKPDEQTDKQNKDADKDAAQDAPKTDPAPPKRL
jgi:hypothetical protein